MIILGVETSAVAAGAAIVKDGKLISEGKYPNNLWK